MKEQVQRAYALDRAGIIADERMNEAESALKDGKTPAQVASQIKGSLREIGWVGRQGTGGLPPEITAQAFSAVAPADGTITHVRSRLANGDRVLILVRQVKDGEMDEVDSAAQAQLKERYGNLVGDQELAVYINALKETMTILLVTNLVQQARRLGDLTCFRNESRVVQVDETEIMFSESPGNQLTYDYIHGVFG